LPEENLKIPIFERSDSEGREGVTGGALYPVGTGDFFWDVV